MVLGLIDFDQIIKIVEDKIEEQLITPKQATVFASRCKTPPPTLEQIAGGVGQSEADSPGRGSSVRFTEEGSCGSPVPMTAKPKSQSAAAAPRPDSAPTVS